MPNEAGGMVRIPAVSISRARENGRRHSRAFSIAYLKSGYSVCEEDLYETELHRLAHTEHPMSQFSRRPFRGQASS